MFLLATSALGKILTRRHIPGYLLRLEEILESSDEEAERARFTDRGSFDTAVVDYATTLATAETLLVTLRAVNINSQSHDFTDIADVNRAGVGLFSELCGAVMQRQWNSL